MDWRSPPVLGSIALGVAAIAGVAVLLAHHLIGHAIGVGALSGLLLLFTFLRR